MERVARPAPLPGLLPPARSASALRPHRPSRPVAGCAAVQVGVAHKLVSGRAPTTTILLQSRWSEERMIKRYARAESLASALPYLEDE